MDCWRRLSLIGMPTWFFGVAFLSSTSACSWGDGNTSTENAPPRPVADVAKIDAFEMKVRPVLAAHCFDCHGPDKQKAGLRLDSREAAIRGGETGPAVVPGKPEESLLVEAISYDGGVQMPPKGKLSAVEVATLTDWVKRGAAWPVAPRESESRSASAASIAASPIGVRESSFWSFRPVRDPLPPEVRDPEWIRTSIDRFILARLEAGNLAPSPPADRRAMLRRVTFDLIGLPPTPEEIEAFVADQMPSAYARVVDRLLASPHYGERWGRHWLDLARYGEDQAHSFQPRLYPQGFRYRDWVIRALNRDMAYDRFVSEQIAGDLLDGPEQQDRLAALGFFALGPVYYGDSKKYDQYADRIDTMTRGLLGLTVACARCHDHKYDPIPTTDYYALAGVFASTEYREAPVAPREQVDAYEKAEDAIRRKTQEINTFLKTEAERLKLKVPKNKVEQSLPEESRKKVAALRGQLNRLKKEAPPKYPVVHTLAEAAKPTNLHVLTRGNPETPGAEVPRRFLSVLGSHGVPFTSGSGRLELAQAISSPDNPLFARVMANRLWQHHFGRGLVATPGNFGTLGERPSHPELLDWLASRLVAGGWSLKALHREIVFSATYQQSSRFDAASFEKDPGNALLWRMNRRRLEVESWRDAMLAVSGRLDPSVGGPSASLDDPDNRRRTCYAAISRHDLAPLLRLFDFPDPNITSAGRVETTVPLQQLFVLNSEFMLRAARDLADRLAAADHDAGDDAGRIKRAYLGLYGRPPTARESAIGQAFLTAEQGGAPWKATTATTGEADVNRWVRYAQALLAANEFLYVD